MPADARKQEYFERLHKLLDDYQRIIIVEADNVGSRQFQKIRIALRGQAVVLMGKNTMIRKAIRDKLESNPKLETLLEHVKLNIGFIFVKGDLNEARKVLDANRVAAPARAGSIAPCKVIIPAGNTGLEPTQTSFLQALNIPSKINKGAVEIINDVHLLEIGQKVGSSEAALLAKLNIKPFSYGLKIRNIYDNGSIYGLEVLDITQDKLIDSFKAAAGNVTLLSLAASFPNALSIPHMVLNAYKNLLAVAVETEFSFPQADKVKAYLADPSAFAAAAPVAAAAAPAAAAAAPAAAEAKKEQPKEEEEDEDMGFGLFD
eukprot:TRINITY_DN394_c0_g1_i10.p1 TRINITY_DN394_c0_g1~~TRINITY_DN394_c0_g1_i10.p1  ORF type:complete len:317 (-),score=86.10 TRINITY_DN394_c0_g1_i10:271-1221(-)